MNGARYSISRALLAILVLATGLHPAEGAFFPRDNIHVDLNSGPNGRIYVGEYDYFPHRCHFRYDLPPGKIVTRVEIIEADEPYVMLYNGQKEVGFVERSRFEIVDKNGNPCTLQSDRAPLEPRAGPSPAATPLPKVSVSNDADTGAATCNQRFAVVVGASNTGKPVSVINLKTRAEVDTYSSPDVGSYVAACDDGSALVLFNGSQLSVSSVRRFSISDEGAITDSGASFTPAGASTSIRKIFAVPGSKVAVALVSQFGGNPKARLVTFSLPGLTAIDSVDLPGINDLSAAVACDGTKVYGRNDSKITGYTLDPVTGALGDSAFLTINNVATVNLRNNFVNALAISRDGTLLAASEGSGPNGPQVTYFDAATGDRAAKADVGPLVNPQMVDSLACCVPIMPSQHTVIFAKNGEIPGAGVAGSGIPEGAKWTTLGIPAIDDSGTVAVKGSWTSPDGKGSGIFSGNTLVAQLGEAAPGINGSSLQTMTDPVIDHGRVAFIGTYGGVPKTGASMVLSNAPGGSLAVIAQAGEKAPSLGDIRFKTFRAAAVADSSVAVFAQLTGGTGANKVNSATDLSLWAQDATHPLTKLLREGDTLTSVGDRQIKTIVAFAVGNGSPAQGRGWLRKPSGGGATTVLALVTFTDRVQALLSVEIGGTITVHAQTGPGAPGAPDVTNGLFASFGAPTVNDVGHAAFLGTLTNFPPDITKANARGLFTRFGTLLSSPLARLGGDAGDTGAKFSAFKDPVLAADDGLAFAATIKGGPAKGLKANTLWYQPPGGPLALLAQGGGGTVPPGTDADGQWKSFTSLAIAPGNGPIFVATLVSGKGGVTGASASGVWARNSSGTLTSVIRTGKTIAGQKLKSFTALTAVPGSLGTTRGFNANSTLAWRATFADKSQAIVTTALP